MTTRDTARQRGSRRARELFVRVGAEMRRARVGAGLSLRQVAAATGISHTQVWRIERAEAPHVDLAVLARLAESIGHELGLAIHPAGAPVRDAAHLALLERLRVRLHRSWSWRTEVPMPIPGDRRSGDATISTAELTILIEAETRLGDIQEVERRAATKARDLGATRVILLVLESRHNRRVIAGTPGLLHRFPVGTRAAMEALARGMDPGADCLIIL